MDMTICEDIVIVGAGISGLTTALGLHRLGLRSLVLESSESLRAAGYAITLWTNAWRALDSIGVGDLVRKKSIQMQGLEIASLNSSVPISEKSSFDTDVKLGEFENRCVIRKDLLETLERELPRETVRYSSKVVSIEESGQFKLLHLADGSVVKTKALIGCDGVNSMVAKWLGLPNPVSTGRSAIRGFVNYPDGHGFEPKFHLYVGGGVRFGFAPCGDSTMFWFCTCSPSVFNYDEHGQNPMNMKQFVVEKICNAPIQVLGFVERTDVDCIFCAPLKFRLPWNILLGKLAKDNVCVVGDALHPMTPDLGQGGCLAIEDSIILARCIGEALLKQPTAGHGKQRDEEECIKIVKGFKNYVKERRWRSFSLVSISYVVGMIQESDGKVMSFLRNKFLTQHTVNIMATMANFDYGKWIVS